MKFGGVGMGEAERPEILFLKQEDVIAAGILDMKMVIGETERAFRLMGEGRVINPAKTMLGLPSNEDWTSFFMSMPSFIGGDVRTAGFKWAAESKRNASVPGMPYGVDLVTLSDPDTAYTKAIMDGTLITAMRTSAMAGIAAKFLAREDSGTVCLVGAGVIGRTMIMAMREVLPNLREILLHDLDMDKAASLAGEFKGGARVTAARDLEGAVRVADVVVTATTSKKPFIRHEWLRRGVTVIQMSMYEIDDDVVLKADKLVVDNWEQLSHGAGCLIKKLCDEGKISRAGASELQEIVTGKKPARESADESITCCTYGIGAIDVVVADKIYRTAREKNIGLTLNQWDAPLWV